MAAVVRQLATTGTVVLILMTGGPPATVFAQGVEDVVREIDSLTLQWTDLEHQRDLLEANWRTDQPVLEQQLLLLERETRALDDFLEASAREQDEVEQRRLELLEQQTRFEQEQAALERSLIRAVPMLRYLRSRLPPPLFDAWADELPRLDSPLLTATEKLQLVVELLGQLDDFEQKITLHEAIMSMPDGRDYIVQQVYLGLSHGWYVTADGRFAAAGMAGSEGWLWTPMNDGRPITEIVDILERRSDPALVSVPLKLSTAAATGAN